MYFYKIGNVSDVILRSVDASAIGSHSIQWNNEPYTILKDKEIEISFKSLTKEVKTNYTILQFNQDYPDELIIKNIALNDKILNLLYENTNEGLCTEYQNCTSDEEGQIYLNKVKNTYYQIFIFSEGGVLESSYGMLTDSVIKVKDPNANYLVVYSFLGENSFLIHPIDNIYFNIDIITKSNIDDTTAPTYYHFEKCALQITKDMYFNNDSNSIDLRFKLTDLINSSITLF